MAGPPFRAPLEYSYGASEYGGRLPRTVSTQPSGSSGNFVSDSALQQNVSCNHDPVLDGLLSAWQNEDRKNSEARLNGKHNSVNDPGAFATPATAAVHETVCKVQPRVYERSPSLTITYNPPPNCKVLHLQCLPPDDHPPPTDLPPPFFTFSNMPPPPPPPATADKYLASHINMPPAHEQPPPNILHPPAYANYTSRTHHGMGAFNPSNLESTQGLHDPENSFSFDLPSWHAACIPIVAASSQINLPPETYMEIGDSQISYDQDPHPLSMSKPTGPHRMGSYSDDQQSKLMTYGGLSGVKICGSPISRPSSGAGGHTSPAAYMQSSYSTGAVSDSAAIMECSGMYAASSQTNSERRSMSVPQSPTPSVNKMDVGQYDASTQQKEQRSSSSTHDVAFRVKTGTLDLYDGFSWRKYGEKAIKKTNHKRSYYKCERHAQSGCNVVKRTQRCSRDEEYVVFTYLGGRHNHHP